MNMRRLSLAFIIFAFCFPNSVYSQDNVQVIVLPFEVHAEKAASYLKTEVSQAIEKHLKKNGATILTPKKIRQFMAGSKRQFRSTQKLWTAARCGFYY